MRLTRVGARSIVGSFVLIDEHEAVIAEIDGLRFRRLELGASGDIPAYHWAYQLCPALAAASAGDLPGPQALASSLAATKGGGEDTDHAAVRALLDRLAAGYGRTALAEIAGADGWYTPPSAKANGSAPPAGARAIARLLALLEGAGMASRNGSAWRLAGALPCRRPRQLWREALAATRHTCWCLVARCGEALPEALRRALEPHDDAAPDGPVLDQLYDAIPTTPRPRRWRRWLWQVCGGLPNTRLLRVLEVAGGSGGLTGALRRAALPPEREYVFTDPDDGMVVRAETRFAGLLSLRCAVLDFGRGLAEQGFDKACHDIVVAGAAFATSPISIAI